eukprot:SAG22_NODE_952_length_6343_cov_3.567265_1_plen_90_part_00
MVSSKTLTGCNAYRHIAHGHAQIRNLAAPAPTPDPPAAAANAQLRRQSQEGIQAIFKVRIRRVHDLTPGPQAPPAVPHELAAHVHEGAR